MKKANELIRQRWVYGAFVVFVALFALVASKKGDVATPAKAATKEAAPVVQAIKAVPPVQNPAPTTQTQPVVDMTASALQTSVQTNQPVVVTQTVPVVAPVVEAKKIVTMKIDGLGTYQIEVKAGENALEVLKQAAYENNFNLGLQTFSFGTMITKIGSKPAERHYYWALVINGEYSMIGADSLVVKDKDQIEWRYEQW